MMDPVAADQATRDRWFAETRRRHNLEQAARTPEERILAADALRAFALEARTLRGEGVPGGDEPPEVWLRLLRRFRR